MDIYLNNIYRELREGIGNRNRHETSSEVVSKRHLLKTPHVSRIHSHMNYGRRPQPNDSTSTYLLVKKLREEDFNIILIYKPQDRKVVIGLRTYDEIDVGKNLSTVGFKNKKAI